MNIITQFFTKNGNKEELRQRIRNDLLNRELRVGRKIFGPVPKGHTREFFRLDAHTWIWIESWKKENGQNMIRNQLLVSSTLHRLYRGI